MNNTKAVVIRTAGNTALAGAIADGMAVGEVRRLNAELGVRRGRDARYWRAKIAEARRKYRRFSPVRGWELALGMAVLLRDERRACQ